MTGFRIVATLLLLCGPWPGATADTPTDMPRYEVPAATTEIVLEPRGSATLRVLFWDIYESTLFTPDGAWSPDIRPLRLDIRYLRNIEAVKLIEQTRKEWQSQGIESEQHEGWLALLEAFGPASPQVMLFLSRWIPRVVQPSLLMALVSVRLMKQASGKISRVYGCHHQPLDQNYGRP